MNGRFAPQAAIRQLISFYIFACQFVEMPPFFEVNPQFRPPRPAANARVDTPWNCRRSSSPVWVWRCGHIRIADVGTHVVQLLHWLCSMRLGCEPSEFTVETLRFLQEGRVAV